jgi:hypothetical protein
VCGFKGLVDLRASFDIVGNAERSSFAVLNEYIHAGGLDEVVDNIRGQRSSTFPDSRRVFFPDTNNEPRGIRSGRVTPPEDYGRAFEQRHSRNIKMVVVTLKIRDSTPTRRGPSRRRLHVRNRLANAASKAASVRWATSGLI